MHDEAAPPSLHGPEVDAAVSAMLCLTPAGATSLSDHGPQSALDQRGEYGSIRDAVVGPADPMT